MSKIFEEALADAKKLKEVAEANAKKAILESVTPRIKEFIEQQILEQDNNLVESKNDVDDVPEEVMQSLLEMIAGKDFVNKVTDKQKLNEAFKRSFDNLSDSEQLQMKNLIQKINQEKNNLKNGRIINSVNTIQENKQMSNREKFYEIDLALLREAVEDKKTELAAKELEEQDDFLSQLDEEDDHGQMEEYSTLFEQDEPAEEMEDMGDLGDAGAEGDAVEIPLDLAQELQSILDAEIAGGADAGGAEDAAGDMAMPDLEDLEDSEEESEEESEEDSLEEMGNYGMDEADEEPLEEMLDVDPDMLREELANIRSMLSEGNVDHHFGGKGSGKTNHANAFGGPGPKKHGYQKAFGGGSEGQDVFVSPPSTLKKLNEAIQQLRKLSRMNRAQNEKLNKYRGAVHTLREQLEDLNLFNAKLLYVNKLLQNKNLNESQKKSVIKALDEAKSLGETKALFKSLTESLSSSKTSLNESTRFGSSSRTTTSGSGNKNRTVGESDRWAKLAGLK